MPDLREATHNLNPLKLSTQIVLHFDGQRLGVEESPEAPALRVNRPRFRNWLATNIPVQWGKRLVGLETKTREGKTVLRFEDGTTAKGDVVVGADGVYSAGKLVSPSVLYKPWTRRVSNNSPRSIVREHLLQRRNNELLRIIPTGSIYGEVTLSGAAFENQLSLGHSAAVVKVDDICRLFVMIDEVSPDGNTGKYFWGLMWADEESPNPDHWLRTASQSRKLEYVLDKIAALESKFTNTVRMTPVSSIKITPWDHRDAEITEIPVSKVTIIGDAAHPMAPCKCEYCQLRFLVLIWILDRGEGGVHGIIDALKLAEALAQVDLDSDTKTVETAVGSYLAEMIPRTLSASRMSRNAPTGYWGNKAVVWGHVVKPLPEEKISLESIRP